MEKAGSHAASLLLRLNRQRERAHFCDCVVRQKQNPGQLYPAHRCVLAASSPVFASLLSSAGALVDLQAPCLPEPTLALVLDYIYTGVLPNNQSQKQCSSLLTAARYLQMHKLQETLESQRNAANNTNFATGARKEPRENNDKTVNVFSKCLSISDGCSVNPLERQDQYCGEIDTAAVDNGANQCDVSDASTSCGVPESSGKKENSVTPQDLIQSSPCTAEIHGMPRVGKEVQRDQFHSADTVNHDSWQMSTEEELEVHTAEVHEEETSRAENMQRLILKSKAEVKQPTSTSHRRGKSSSSQCSSPPTPSSQHQCSGAVPVIRHSSTASVEEVSTAPTCHPVSQASARRTPDVQSGSTDHDIAVESTTTNHTNPYGMQISPSVISKSKNLDYDNIGMQSSRFDECGLQDYKPIGDQCVVLKQEHNSISTGHIKHVDGELFHITDDNHHADCDSREDHAKHFRHDLKRPNKDCSRFTRGITYKTPTSKHQRLDYSDRHNVTTATEEQRLHSHDPRAIVGLHVQDTGTGSDSHCEDLWREGEAKEEPNYSSEMDGQESHCNPCRPPNDWYSHLHRGKTSTKDAALGRHEHGDKDTAMDDVTGCKSLEHESISEPHGTFTVPTEDNVSDATCNVVEQSYYGCYYHCLPQEDANLPHGDPSDHKYSSQPDNSDQSSAEEEGDAFANPGLSPLRQHFATTDQVLLLDISAKPAELLVSYRHRSGEPEKRVAFGEKESSGDELCDSHGEERHEATPAARIDKRKSRARNNFGSDDERTSVKEQCRSGAGVLHTAGNVNSENQPCTFTVCSPPSLPDSEQAVSSAMSVCIPSTLSASLPTNISAHLSTPAHHPFQCSLCDRSFSQRGSLNRHVRSHLGVRPFPCPRCPMTFSRQYRVIEHMRVHQRCVLGSDVFKSPLPLQCQNEKRPRK